MVPLSLRRLKMIVSIVKMLLRSRETRAKYVSRLLLSIVTSCLPLNTFGPPFVTPSCLCNTTNLTMPTIHRSFESAFPRIFNNS